MKNFVLIATLILSLELISCSNEIGRRPGWITRSVEGKIELNQPISTTRPFILVRYYNRLFIETSQGYLYRISASIVKPDEQGIYRIYWEDEVDKVELLLIVEGYRTQSAIFQRSLGVGAYEADFQPVKDQNWKENFYLAIKPVLTEFIVEERYQLSKMDQLYIGNWLDRIEDGFQNSSFNQKVNEEN